MEVDTTALDENDLEILKHIEQYGMDDLKQLADEIELSQSTIYYRIDRLKEQGVISGITADVNPLALGLEILMISRVFVVHDPGYAEDIGESLADIAGVQEVYYTMGDVDFIVFSRSPNRDQMNRIIDEIVQIDGVNETSSTFVLDEIKRGQNIVGSYTAEQLTEALFQAD